MTAPRTSRHPGLGRRLRRALVSLAALGLLGAAAQANAIVRLEREALEARVDAMRDALARDMAREGALPRLVAQWNNFKNWNNWNNWKKWLNQ